MAKSKKKQKVSIVITKDMLIAIIVILLIAAIALATIYFAFPETWDQLVLLVLGPEQGPPNNGIAINKGDLNIFFIDVGQGDSILTILPDGKTILIDGGNKGNTIASAITDTLDSLYIDTLDYVILTHTDADHCGSLDDALTHRHPDTDELIQVKNIYIPKIDTDNNLLNLDNRYLTIGTDVYRDFITVAKAATYIDENNKTQKAKIHYLEDIMYITDEEIIDGKPTYSYKMTMFCRNDKYYQDMTDDAHDLNDVSPICVLECNNRKVIYTGDANNETSQTSSEVNFIKQMKALGYSEKPGDPNDFDADILKVAHHGSQGSSGDAFLSFINCEYAIVSSGGDVINDNGIDEGSKRDEYDLYLSQKFDEQGLNIQHFHGNKKYDHPHSDVCKDGGRLEQNGIQEVYYTVLNGTIACTIDQSSNITFKPTKVAVRSGNDIIFKAA